ncbi:NAD(P)H:quinone oxidoreductase [Modestobacter sp. I12A-02628]|uniref:NAD(P)H:quinone oxidoreductase n=1 Tax=Goekera deserti TaxID=2497753 RepID=A0A7K3WJA6_9ACTN|nr:NAD(P)H:quinone oxidoreductase [Goekera deserti]MPQ97057.1 NAD(P)H:quinone oxidoreductase [Goekera deserti]NDI46626.1 NAD(P)H:quinone oxidoreductase [Goekera deserti]NEL56382.1 NAD(P)H:quinone oxidoreductase [Goekera deserti]
MTRIAVVYYSSTGNVHQLAEAVAAGAADAGAEVRLRRVAELAPDAAIDANPLWRAHVDATAETVEVATPADMEWADGYALGTPTRFGTPAAQLKQFIDSLGGLWFTGKLADKGATAFTSAQNTHGGNESTLLTLFNIFTHFGAIIVPPGYTDPSVFAAGGNPYGASVSSGGDSAAASAEVLAAARYQGRRLAEITAKLVS